VKADAWREKADVELREELEALRKELFHRQFRGGSDEVEERGRFRKLRREVARIETILRERALGVRGQRRMGAEGKDEESRAGKNA
jgi:large subunit ribosomal protein L29